MAWLNVSLLNMLQEKFKDLSRLGLGEIICSTLLLVFFTCLLASTEFITSASSVYREFLVFWHLSVNTWKPIDPDQNVRESISHCLSIDYTTQLGRLINLVSICSILTLLDRVNLLRNQLLESNRVHSRQYYSIASLC